MNKLIATLIVLSLLSSIEALTIPDKKLTSNMFKGFGARFARNYKSSIESSYRQELYEEHMKEIQMFNKEGNTWTKGENMFTDMTSTERKAYLGLLPTTDNIEPQSIDSSFPKATDESVDSNGAPTLSGLVTSTVTTNPFASLPQKVDWVAAGIMTAVKNQGNCGCCWAFTTTALVESLYKRKYGNIVNLAEQELVDCATTSNYVNYGCNGGFSINALNYYQLFGVHTEANYPYAAVQRTCKKSTTTAYKVATVTPVKIRSLLALLTALSAGPVATAFYVADDFFDYNSGIYNHKAGCTGATTVNHAVLAVGYDLNSTAPYIKFKNSWGQYFGEYGYFRMSMSLVDFGYGPCNLLKFNTSVYASL